MGKQSFLRKNKKVKLLKEELENNSKTYEKNNELLNLKIELKKANLEEFEFEKKRHELIKSIIDIEIRNYRVITPLMEFHQMRDWQDKWKELKEFELENNDRNFKLAQKNFENRLNHIDANINEEKIKGQQQRIQERNPQIISQLKSLGIDENIKAEKQDYIQ